MDNYSTHIETAIENAKKHQSKITPDIIAMEGMSGTATRHFYNNLLQITDSRYLEIGTWKGSSVCSAMYKNNATVICIDNWSQFNGPKKDFITNFTRYKGTNNARFIESDCFTVDISTLPRFNIYLYDGAHTEESHYKALTYYYNCLDDIFIFIVDDWNWKSVRDGTMRAIKDLRLKELFCRQIRTTLNNQHPEMGSPEQKEWHNGLYVCVLQKTQ